MDGFSPELEIVAVREKAPNPHHGMERIGDTTTAAEGAHNMVDMPLMHFPANTNWPMPAAPGLNAAIPTQFTILFNGNTFVYDGIPAEKVQEIMLIAAAYAKSAEMKIGTQSSFTPLIHTTPSSPQGNSNNLASQQSVCFPPPKKSSICRLQEFPIARRQSLQRFLEKRRFRLGNRAPYVSSSKKMDGNMENSFYANNASDLVSNDGFQASIAAT